MTITTARPKPGALGLRFQKPNQSVRLSLRAHGLLTLDVPKDGLEICGPTGHLWLTREGDSTDYIVPPGESFRTAQGGRVIVEALEDSTFTLCEAN